MKIRGTGSNFRRRPYFPSTKITHFFINKNHIFFHQEKTHISPWRRITHFFINTNHTCRTMKRSSRGSNSFDKIVERQTPSVSEGLLQPSMNLLSGDNTLFHTYLPTRVISTIWLSLRGCIIVLLSPSCRQVSHCILHTRILVCPLVFCLDCLIVFVVATFAPCARLLQVI